MQTAHIHTNNHLLTPHIASITELKHNPMQVVSENEATAILNRNKPVFYCVSPQLLAYYQQLEEDMELNKIADERLATLQAVEVSLDDL